MLCYDWILQVIKQLNNEFGEMCVQAVVERSRIFFCRCNLCPDVDFDVSANFNIQITSWKPDTQLRLVSNITVFMAA
jgi:hypothetical protein